MSATLPHSTFDTSGLTTREKSHREIIERHRLGRSVRPPDARGAGAGKAGAAEARAFDHARVECSAHATNTSLCG